MKALEDAVDRRVLNSPIALEAEVLPGPNGYLPRMACVFKNASAYHDAYLWDDYDYDGREDDSNTTRAPGPRPPPASCSLRQYQEALAADALVLRSGGFRAHRPRRLPGAVLAPGAASGGVPCAGVRVAEGSDADVAWSYERQALAANGGNVSAEVAAMADKGVDGGFRLDNWRRVSRFMRRDATRAKDVKVFKFDELPARADKDKDKDDAGTDAAAAADLDMIKLPSSSPRIRSSRATARGRAPRRRWTRRAPAGAAA